MTDHRDLKHQCCQNSTTLLRNGEPGTPAWQHGFDQFQPGAKPGARCKIKALR